MTSPRERPTEPVPRDLPERAPARPRPDDAVDACVEDNDAAGDGGAIPG